MVVTRVRCGTGQVPRGGVWCVLLSTALLSAASAPAVPLIIDTDAGFDVDDVGAVCVGNALADLGEADIIGEARIAVSRQSTVRVLRPRA
eukprot:SAG31_NODE_3874_length_3794_cov_2.431818_5_plen_90_part_00